jgi:hypothetical protein
MMMTDGGRLARWRRSAVDGLIGAAALSVAVATLGATDILDMLLFSGALLGLALLLEPNVLDVLGARQNNAERPGFLRLLTHSTAE